MTNAYVQRPKVFFCAKQPSPNSLDHRPRGATANRQHRPGQARQPPAVAGAPIKIKKQDTSAKARAPALLHHTPGQAADHSINPKCLAIRSQTSSRVSSPCSSRTTVKNRCVRIRSHVPDCFPALGSSSCFCIRMGLSDEFRALHKAAFLRITGSFELGLCAFAPPKGFPIGPEIAIVAASCSFEIPTFRLPFSRAAGGRLRPLWKPSGTHPLHFCRKTLTAP